MNESNFVFSPENVSKYWKLLNYSNNPNDKKTANSFLAAFKKKCPNCLEISMSLFSRESSQDKLISSLLIYQYIKENPKKLLENKELYNQMKDYILNQILIPYTKEQSEKKAKNEMSLIIERICYTMSIIILLGCISHWPNAIDDMLLFGSPS